MPEMKFPKPEVMPDVKAEQSVEQQAGKSEKLPAESQAAEPIPTVSSAAGAQIILTEPQELQKKVESVLAEGLTELYQELSPGEKLKFKTSGEATAKKITRLLQEVKIKFSEILNLIRIWLMSITGINRFFVEQEAKIKAEKILKLRQGK
jgi:hypothetical protein